MKIARIKSISGEIEYIEPLSDRRGNLLSGDLEIGYTRQNQEIEYEELLAPIVPTCMLCIGLNYKEHAAETGKKPPERPMLFIKSPNVLLDPFKPIELPRHLESQKVDYEGELAVVIGKAAKNVAEEEALDYVFGYTIANDVSARDWQWELGNGQYCQGKSFDTFAPLGPWIVTTDDIANPNDLKIETRVNDQIRQSSSTSDMIFSVARIISFLSGSKTLLPGTVILTGTPPGVGGGMNPPTYLNSGDKIEIEIEKIGRLENPIVEEAT